MYIDLGRSTVVPHRDILAIFDLDNASWAYKTREYLARAEQEGRAIWLTEELPRSFVLVDSRWGEPVIYLSSMSTKKLKARIARGGFG